MIFYNIYIDVYVTLCVGHFYLWGGVFLGGGGCWGFGVGVGEGSHCLCLNCSCVVNLFFYDKVVLS